VVVDEVLTRHEFIGITDSQLLGFIPLVALVRSGVLKVRLVEIRSHLTPHFNALDVS